MFEMEEDDLLNSKLIICPEMTLFSAMKYMDEIERKLLIICKEDYFVGLISIGDIQRALIHKIDLQEPVSKYIRDDILYCSVDDSIDEIKDRMRNERIECMPIVNNKKQLIDIIEWEDIFDKDDDKGQGKIQIPVVIMAGGEGKRLRPLTNIIPKPLIPISDKTIIEEIMDQFIAIGSSQFYLSINYMGGKIKEYFWKKKEEYTISYIEENKALGTAGSLRLLKETIHQTFFVSNCDVLVDVNYKDLLDYHRNNGNMATIVSVVKDYAIPYGTLETKDNGLLVELNEKPTLTYQINSGLYVLEPEVFDYIEERKKTDITELFAVMIRNQQKIGVFPVSDKSYVDMGNWKEYMRLIENKGLLI